MYMHDIGLLHTPVTVAIKFKYNTKAITPDGLCSAIVVRFVKNRHTLKMNKMLVPMFLLLLLEMIVPVMSVLNSVQVISYRCTGVLM